MPVPFFQVARIRDASSHFAEKIADSAEDFLAMNQYGQINDLIVTGGGTMIPAVRQALQSRLEPYGFQIIHMYIQPDLPPQPGQHRLNISLARGATALGGASVYFDFSEGNDS